MKKDRKNEDRGRKERLSLHSGQTTRAGKDGRTGELMTVKLNILTFAFAMD